MTRQRITPVAVLLAAVLAMGTGAARAQETLNIAVDASVPVSPSAEQVIVTGVSGPVRTFAGTCMAYEGFAGQHSSSAFVIIDKTVPPAATILPEMHFAKPVAPGTRLSNFTLVDICSEGGVTWNVFECKVANPKNLKVALVTTPADVTLAEDHEAVVGAGTDELGMADAVCVKKGQKSIKTEIISDIPLEPGDRLTGFLQLDFDTDTGETLYGAWLEY